MLCLCIEGVMCCVLSHGLRMYIKSKRMLLYVGTPFVCVEQRHQYTHSPLYSRKIRELGLANPWECKIPSNCQTIDLWNKFYCDIYTEKDWYFYSIIMPYKQLKHTIRHCEHTSFFVLPLKNIKKQCWCTANVYFWRHTCEGGHISCSCYCGLIVFVLCRKHRVLCVSL